VTNSEDRLLYGGENTRWTTLDDSDFRGVTLRLAVSFLAYGIWPPAAAWQSLCGCPQLWSEILSSAAHRQARWRPNSLRDRDADPWNL